VEAVDASMDRGLDSYKSVSKKSIVINYKRIIL